VPEAAQRAIEIAARGRAFVRQAKILRLLGAVE
jgi:hypothetical protein